MEPRMALGAHLPGDAFRLLKELGATVKAAGAGLPLELVYMRASQINGCSVCVQLHGRALRASGEPDERIWAVGAWREAACFTPAERAALALAESVTRLADRPDPVPDEVWDEAARHYDEPALAMLVLAIAQINVFNRLNAATRQVARAGT